MTRPFCWYQIKGHLSRSRSNIKVTIFKKWPLLGHLCFTNTSCSILVMWESSQWLGKNIVWSTGKKNFRKAMIGALAAATKIEILLKMA